MTKEICQDAANHVMAWLKATADLETLDLTEGASFDVKTEQGSRDAIYYGQSKQKQIDKMAQSLADDRVKKGYLSFAEKMEQFGLPGQAVKPEPLTMADVFAGKTGEKINQDLKYSFKNVANILKNEIMNLPEQVIDGGVYKKVDEALGKWYASNENFDAKLGRSSYMQKVGVPAKGFVNDINEAALEATSKSDLSQRLEAKGLKIDPEKLWMTREYLDYLSRGGPFFQTEAKEPSALVKTAKQGAQNLLQNMFRFSTMVATGNVSEIFSKGIALYPKQFMPGLMKAIKETDGKLWQDIPDIRKRGYYSFYLGSEKEGKFDWMQKSQKILENIAYYVGKESGDIDKAMSTMAYKNKPWNRPITYWNKQNKLATGVTEFAVNNMRVYYSLWGDLLGNGVKAIKGEKANIPQMKAAAAKLAAWSAVNYAMFGDKAALPAPFAWADSLYKQFSGDSGTDEHFRGAVGELLGIDMGDYVAPGGGTALFIPIKMASLIAESITGSRTRKGDVQRIVEYIANQDYGKAATRATALGAKASMFMFSSDDVRAMPYTFVKMFDETMKAYENDELDQLGTYVKGALFGKSSVAKDDDHSILNDIIEDLEEKLKDKEDENGN